MEKVKVIDSIMGSGKSTFMIKHMNSNPENRYLYITPYLTEVQRIKDACPDVDFATPSEEAITKMADFHYLMKEGKSIVMTHELFSRLSMSQAVCQRIKEYRYT